MRPDRRRGGGRTRLAREAEMKGFATDGVCSSVGCVDGQERGGLHRCRKERLDCHGHCWSVTDDDNDGAESNVRR